MIAELTREYYKQSIIWNNYRMNELNTIMEYFKAAGNMTIVNEYGNLIKAYSDLGHYYFLKLNPNEIGMYAKDLYEYFSGMDYRAALNKIIIQHVALVNEHKRELDRLNYPEYFNSFYKNFNENAANWHTETLKYISK